MNSFRKIYSNLSNKNMTSIDQASNSKMDVICIDNETLNSCIQNYMLDNMYSTVRF